MTGSIEALVLAIALFVVSHVAMSGSRVREPIVRRIGEGPFRGLYSVVSLVLIVWVSMAYNAAPYVDVWEPGTALRHLSLTVMAFACVFVVCGLATPNPTLAAGDSAAIAANGPVGIFKVTRHPMMWGLGLWGIAHLAANGDGASIVLFGALTALALVGPLSIEARKRRQLGPVWEAYSAETSYVPFAALIAGRTRVGLGEIGWARIAGGLVLYAVLLFAHPWAFGVDPLAV